MSKLFGLGHFAPGTSVSVWSEVKLKFESNRKRFDYTFDYIVMMSGRLSRHEIEKTTKSSWDRLLPGLRSAGYQITGKLGEEQVDGFPTGRPLILEIMTSSTSGGNKKKRSTTPMAFEDGLLGRPHSAPGINYRQVWARMVSQLLVKSEVGLEWGGRTFWILQDNLVDYISQSTALDIRSFRSSEASEVNIVSAGYRRLRKGGRGPISLDDVSFYSGPMSPTNASGEPSFQDMIRAPVHPPLHLLFRLLSKRAPVSRFEVGGGFAELS